MSKCVKVNKNISEYMKWDDLFGKIQLYDEFECTLKNGKSAAFVLIDEKDGYMTFCSKDCIEMHRMNDASTNKGGIAESEMQKYLDTEVWNLLPDELQALISDTKRLYMDGEQKKEFHTKLFLLSASEVFDKDNCYGEEGLYNQLEYFKYEKNRVKCMDKETDFWWLASPRASISACFCIVSRSGAANYGGASSTYGAVPCFSIKKS